MPRISGKSAVVVAALGVALTVGAVGLSASLMRPAPLECWSDLGSGESLCVPMGQDLAAAVDERFGIHLLEERSPGVTVDLVTGEVMSNREAFLRN